MNNPRTSRVKISELQVGNLVRLEDGRAAAIEKITRMAIFDGDARLVVWQVGSQKGESIQPGDAIVEVFDEDVAAILTRLDDDLEESAGGED
jgi:hypothetical protein